MRRKVVHLTTVKCCFGGWKGPSRQKRWSGFCKNHVVAEEVEGCVRWLSKLTFHTSNVVCYHVTRMLEVGTLDSCLQLEYGLLNKFFRATLNALKGVCWNWIPAWRLQRFRHQCCCSIVISNAAVQRIAWTISMSIGNGIEDWGFVRTRKPIQLWRLRCSTCVGPKHAGSRRRRLWRLEMRVWHPTRVDANQSHLSRCWGRWNNEQPSGWRKSSGHPSSAAAACSRWGGNDASTRMERRSVSSGFDAVPTVNVVEPCGIVT